MSTAVLFLWPVAILYFFRKYPPALAVCLAIFGGYLFLPTGTVILLPKVPDIDKESVAVIPALLFAILFATQYSRGRMKQTNSGPLPGWIPRSGLVVCLLLFVIGGVLLTAMTNGRAVVYGERVLRGMTLFDGMSTLLRTIVAILPFLLARKFLARPEDHRMLVIFFCLAGLVYSFFALYEVRMSPVLNKMIYGYFPHEWAQHKRGDGWRPIVFMYHGLWVSIFFACASIAAAALVRIATDEWRTRAWLALGWLLMTLVLTKSLGAVMISMVIVPIMFLSVRTQMIFAAFVSLVIITYPMLRGAGAVPITPIMGFASAIDEGRAESFFFRLDNEEALLQKANRKPLFGWGDFGRARIFDKRGRSQSTTDGFWIILLGEGGWIRYIGTFGLLVTPIIVLTMRQKSNEISASTAALCLILTANIVDLIPNATITPLTWLVAGALAGRMELRASELQKPSDQPTQALVPTGPQYSRFPAHKGRQSTI